MINLYDIRYCHVGTPDVPAAVDFCTKIVGLGRVRTENGREFFRGDNRDHTLVYFKGDPADHTVGFELLTSEEIDSAAVELKAKGIEVYAGTPEECG